MNIKFLMFNIVFYLLNAKINVIYNLIENINSYLLGRK